MIGRSRRRTAVFKLDSKTGTHAIAKLGQNRKIVKEFPVAKFLSAFKFFKNKNRRYIF